MNIGQPSSSISVAGVVQVTGIAGAPVVSSTAPNANAKTQKATVTNAESNIAAPANAVGVVIQADDANADNVRYGASNSNTAGVVSATVGNLLEPGRDSGFLPLGAGTFVHLIATGGGADTVQLTWVMSA
jgi:hypothetical protein